MHIPKHFELTNPMVIEQIIRETGLATLITKGSVYPAGTHIPLELEVNDQQQKVLRGHMSKANPQWKEFSQDDHVLAIFLSPVHSYISSSWYNQPNAPTWNYVSVHVTGTISILDEAGSWASVRRLTNRYEQGRHNPVSLDTLPVSVQKQMNGIICFEIHIEKIEAACKLSQNRNDEDFANVVQQLRLSSHVQDALMADLMERYRQKGPDQLCPFHNTAITTTGL